MTMFSLSETSNGRSLAIFYNNGDTDSIGEQHVQFDHVLDLLLSGKADDDTVRDLVNVKKTVDRKLSMLSERVSFDGETVYFDGDPLAGELSEVIVELASNGTEMDFRPLVNFLEKVSTNPDMRSIDDLYRWIKAGDLVIDPEGDIIAYKAVKVIDGVSHSISQGTAFVNGVEITGNIPNVPGTVVSMPRSGVDADYHEGCSYGLHAGTYSYADWFRIYHERRGDTTRILLVKFNPRDVVTVPADSGSMKLRVCRYVVLQEIEERMGKRVFTPREEDIEAYPDYADDDDQEDYEWCDLCNSYLCPEDECLEEFYAEEEEEEDEEWNDDDDDDFGDGTCHCDYCR